MSVSTHSFAASAIFTHWANADAWSNSQEEMIRTLFSSIIKYHLGMVIHWFTGIGISMIKPRSMRPRFHVPAKCFFLILVFCIPPQAWIKDRKVLSRPTPTSNTHTSDTATLHIFRGIDQVDWKSRTLAASARGSTSRLCREVKMAVKKWAATANRGCQKIEQSFLKKALFPVVFHYKWCSAPVLFDTHSTVLTWSS
jgi:hypothetical protein